MLLLAPACDLDAHQIPRRFSPPSTDLLDDRPEQLVPRQARSEADEDRLQAETQFAHGRMLLHRDQAAEALARFERSFRYDPSPVIAQEIISIASELNRHAEAVRYAILAEELRPTDGDLAVRLAGFLAERGETTRAITMLENAAHRATRPPAGLNRVLLQAELMRLYLLTDQSDLAVKPADLVREALDQPDRQGLAAADHEKLKAQRERLDTLVAETYLRAHRFADAESVFRALHQALPKEGVLQYQLARIAAEQKSWKLARERLESSFRDRGTELGFEPYELLARIVAGEVGDESRAKAETLKALQQLRERDPRNNALGYFTAARLLDAKDWDAAAGLYEELLARQPTTTAYRHLAEIYRQKKDSAALLRILGRAIEQSASREMLSAEVESIAKDANLFEQLVAAVKTKNPAQVSAVPTLLGVTLVAIAAGRTETARELYAKTVAVPEADLMKVRETIGMAALLANQHPFAIEVFQQAIAARPPNDKLAAYYYYLAGSLEFAGQTDQALVAAEKSASLKRDSILFQTRPAWVLYHARRLDEAERRYRDLVARFDRKYESDDVREQVRQSRLILSNICVLSKRLAEAEAWLEQVLDEFPEYIGALNDLGYLWADQGKRLQRALRMVEQAVQGDPDNAAYRDSLGWAYYRLGRYADAVRELERAATAAQDGIIYDHLGDAYLKADDRPKALDAWRKGAELLTAPDEAQHKAVLTAKIKQHSVSEN